MNERDFKEAVEEVGEEKAVKIRKDVDWFEKTFTVRRIVGVGLTALGIILIWIAI